MRERSRWGGVLMVLLLLVALAGSSPGFARKKQKERSLLRLRASVQAGFAPLEITFTGRLTNVEAEDETFCHAGTFLMRKFASDNYQVLAGEDPACVHSPDTNSVPLTFSFEHIVGVSGHYEFVAMVKTRDGARILSNAVPVRVIASPGGR